MRDWLFNSFSPPRHQTTTTTATTLESHLSNVVSVFLASPTTTDDRNHNSGLVAFLVDFSLKQKFENPNPLARIFFERERGEFWLFSAVMDYLLKKLFDEFAISFIDKMLI